MQRISGTKKRLIGSIGFFLAVAMTVALASAGTAAAQDNTSYGDNALIHLTTGTENSAFGAQALDFNSTG